MITLSFRKPASGESWHHFIQAVAELFCQMPAFMLPSSNLQTPLACAGDRSASDALVIGEPHSGHIGTGNAASAARILMLTPEPYVSGNAVPVHMPDAQSDFIVRLTLVLLEVYCPEYAHVSWGHDSRQILPQLWLHQHTGHLEPLLPASYWQGLALHPVVHEAVAGLTRSNRMTDSARLNCWNIVQQAERALRLTADAVT